MPNGRLVMCVIGWTSLAATSPLHARTAEPMQTGAVRPPENLVAADHPWDGGDAVDLSWQPAVVDEAEQATQRITWRYTDRSAEALREELGARIAELDRRLADDQRNQALRRALRHAREEFQAAVANEPVEAAVVGAGTGEHTVKGLRPGLRYLFEVQLLVNGVPTMPPAVSNGQEPRVQAFDQDRDYEALIALAVCGSILAFIILARGGMRMKIRRIAGLEAVDEAVGRATEMGRPVLFINGMMDMNEMMTLAGLTVLSKVSRTAAEYDATLEVPTNRSLVMTAARETVQGSYLAAGRPDAYNENLIYYVTDEQFGFVAYLTGHMVRQKPAACFYFGAFFAESLILSETGNSIGAIQIAGTAETAQLPFFVAACDYTLIGEEFYAASAYLSGEPDQLGALRGQDMGKIIVALGLAVGCAIATFASVQGPSSSYGQALGYLKANILR